MNTRIQVLHQYTNAARWDELGSKDLLSELTQGADDWNTRPAIDSVPSVFKIHNQMHLQMVLRIIDGFTMFVIRSNGANSVVAAPYEFIFENGQPVNLTMPPYSEILHGNVVACCYDAQELSAVMGHFVNMGYAVKYIGHNKYTLS